MEMDYGRKIIYINEVVKADDFIKVVELVSIDTGWIIIKKIDVDSSQIEDGQLKLL